MTWTRFRWLLGNAVLAALTVFALWFWTGAYEVSKSTGAGAAQGDLGIFINLMIGSPFVLGLTFFAWMLAGYGPGSRLTNVLAVLAVAAVAWNWVFLLFFWRTMEP